MEDIWGPKKAGPISGPGTLRKAEERRRWFCARKPTAVPGEVSRDIFAGQKLRKVISANNERESFADYKLDYPSLGRRGRALNPAYRRVLLSEGRKSFSG